MELERTGLKYTDALEHLAGAALAGRPEQPVEQGALLALVLVASAQL